MHGSLAHGDDTDGSDVDLVVVTTGPDAGPRPAPAASTASSSTSSVIGADEYLRHARTLTTPWPLVADQYITTGPLHDPRGWFAALRDTHLAQLAETRPARVRRAGPARRGAGAASAHARAGRLAEWYETDAALRAARRGPAARGARWTGCSPARTSATAPTRCTAPAWPAPTSTELGAVLSRRPRSWPPGAARSTATSTTCSSLSRRQAAGRR